MKYGTSLRIQTALSLATVAWVALGVLAAWLIGGQPGWFAASVAVLLATLTAAVAEMRMARLTGEMLREGARTVVEGWPHVIAVLEDMERIEPERAEIFEVVRLDMVRHLERARPVAEGRVPAPSWRQALSWHRKTKR